MALFLVPFYLRRFIRLQEKHFKFFLFFIGLFGCWFFGGLAAFVMGDGTTQDVFFHLVVSFKILLNLFFGHLVYSVVKDNNSSLLIWLLVQILVICVSMVNLDFYQFLLGFISPRSADVFQHIYGLRALGFGLYHVDGALTLIIAAFYYLLIAKASSTKTLLLVFMLPVSMAVARSAIVPYAILGVLKRGVLVKFCLFVSILTMLLLSMLVSSGPIYESTEIFRNFLNRGTFHSDSVNALANMYFLPDSLKVYMFGVGKYFDSSSSKLMFYMGTDVGYLRLLFYSGVGSVFVFVALNIFALLGVICSRSYPGSYDVKAFAFALCCIFFIVNFKGLQVMSIFAFTLYFYASDRKKQADIVAH
ncbi:hypothetical protein [Pseudomonas sp. NKUCC02_KPG]|uniref:hypothetical protein n=1 Tax=Pseudomonas sp. NKUCC02_KPG TaxID=2842124 RepID=UPI001C5B992A|nr:hypothetical protein [Pseudomonas sp. NKUCC02_KPG]MBW3503949.1 hypothetical protein [Pseudomonas sp. NKUCC02_KPG]